MTREPWRPTYCSSRGSKRFLFGRASLTRRNVSTRWRFKYNPGTSSPLTGGGSRIRVACLFVNIDPRAEEEEEEEWHATAVLKNLLGNLFPSEFTRRER